MQLYKDGKVVRTYYEQVDHLTKEHEKQLTVNQNVAKQLQSLTENSRIGGADYIRFAFQRSGTFYKLNYINAALKDFGEVGDYIEITSKNIEDIPAYGYLNEGFDETIVFNPSSNGDFAAIRTSLTLINVTKNTSKEVEAIEANYSSFQGTSLLDFDANNVKNRIFNVMTDLSYNTKTQYVSFDLNNDGNYNFVFVGAIEQGKNGTNIFTTDGTNVSEVINQISLGDSILFAKDNTTTLVNADAKAGDIYKFEGGSTYSFQGNIRGASGLNGEQGIQGIQGIQGVQGVQGPTGAKGDKGDKGDSGMSLSIHTGVLNSASELPDFSTATIGDAYRVINTSGTVVTYDLYFKAVDGTTWDIQPNWGGIKGDKGDKGDTGPQGLQGIQGPQGPQGVQGIQGKQGAGVFRHVCGYYDEATDTNIRGIFTCNRQELFTQGQDLLHYLREVISQQVVTGVGELPFPDVFHYRSPSHDFYGSLVISYYHDLDLSGFKAYLLTPENTLFNITSLYGKIKTNYIFSL